MTSVLDEQALEEIALHEWMLRHVTWAPEGFAARRRRINELAADLDRAVLHAHTGGRIQPVHGRRPR